MNPVKDDVWQQDDPCNDDWKFTVCAYVYTYIYILDVLDVFYLYELCVYISMYLYTVNICRYL